MPSLRRNLRDWVCYKENPLIPLLVFIVFLRDDKIEMLLCVNASGMRMFMVV
jgi:hypothetical protein